MLGNEEAARSGYERLVQEFRQGEFAGAGAYRLGEYLFADKKYDPALIQFRLAAAEADNDEVRISAKYNMARCLDRLKRRDEAAKLYEEVAAVQKDNPYLYYARLSLAENAAAVGRRKEALEGFSDIASGSGTVCRPRRGGCQSGRPRGGARRQATCAQAFQRGVRVLGKRRLETYGLPRRNPAQF